MMICPVRSRDWSPRTFLHGYLPSYVCVWIYFDDINSRILVHHVCLITSFISWLGWRTACIVTIAASLWRKKYTKYTIYVQTKYTIKYASSQKPTSRIIQEKSVYLIRLGLQCLFHLRVQMTLTHKRHRINPTVSSPLWLKSSKPILREK